MINAAMIKELREVTGAGMLDCKKALQETNGNMDEAVKWLREKGIMKAAKKETRIAAEGLCKVAVDGNFATVFEVNSETDFVAKNQKFLDLVDQIAKAILDGKAKNDEEANECEYEGVKVKDLVVNAVATIGEKITLRRVNSYEKTDSQVFGAYTHMNGKIVVLSVLEGGSEEVAKDVCMHVAAMNPKYIDKTYVDAEFLANETEILKQETLNEGKPAAIVDKIVAGKVQKMLKGICLVDQPIVKNEDVTVGQFVENNKATIKYYIRLGVGEGIEKRKDDFAAEVMAAVNSKK